MDRDRPVRVPEGGLDAPDREQELSAGLRDRIDRILIPEVRIQARVRALARRIADDYRECKRVSAVIVLDGAVIFAADLGREVHRLGGPEIDFDFIKTRTYGEEIKQKNETDRDVAVIVEPRRLTGKHVLVVEDVLDQGFTLSKILQLIRRQEPASLETCLLLSKELDHPTEEVKRIRQSVALSYVGFVVPDRWVAGYGIDVAGDFRELPFIVAVREDHYSRK